MTKPKLDLKVDVPVELIKELLTQSEWRMVKQRLLIIELLEQGLSIRVIAQKAKVGTDTVVRMSKKLINSPILRKAFQKSSKTQSSKWVFGKGNSS